jgi:hypothetical protein
MLELMFQKELVGNRKGEFKVPNMIINKKIKNEYIIGTVELQALKRLYKNNLITEADYNLLKNKIRKEYHIFL